MNNQNKLCPLKFNAQYQIQVPNPLDAKFVIDAIRRYREDILKCERDKCMGWIEVGDGLGHCVFRDFYNIAQGLKHGTTSN